MATRASHRHRRRLTPGISLTPMLDVIFNLLFFFILATTLRQEALEMAVQLPGSTQAEVKDEQPPEYILLTETGELFFRKERIDEGRLSLELYRLAGEGTRTMEIKADERIEFGRIIQLMDICKEAGLSEVSWELIARDPASQ